MVAEALVEASLAGHDSHGVVRFPQMSQLQKDGSGLFKAPDSMPPQTPLPPNRVRVIQGAL